MPSVRCPDCGALIELPEGTRSGDLVECPNCAGMPSAFVRTQVVGRRRLPTGQLPGLR